MFHKNIVTPPLYDWRKMTDYASIRADESAVEAAREAKRDDETWGEYLLRCADADVPRKWTESEIRGVARAEAREAIEELAR